MSLTEGQRDEIAAYLKRSEEDLLEEVSLYVPAVRGDPLNPYIVRLKQAICDGWNWCQRRQDARFNDELTAATAVCDVLILAQVNAPIPVTLLTSIIVKRRLDVFCNCPPVQARV